MKYRRPSRFRRVAKWIGLGLCVLIMGAWVATSFVGVKYYVTDDTAANAGWGMVRITWGDSWLNSYIPPNSFLTGYFSGGYPDDRWVIRKQYAFGWLGFAREWHRGPLPLGTAGSGPEHLPGFINIPFWLALLVTAIPTTILWRLDRRPREGHCLRCGYNLTGNESGVCPECSTPVPKQEAAP